MTAKEIFEHESVQDNRTISRYLHALNEGFEKGRVIFESPDRQLLLSPNNLLNFSMKVKKKGDKSKITLKISWKESGGGMLSDSGLKISSENR